jgi:hypothetical protein
LPRAQIQGATERDWEDIAVGPGPDPDRSWVYTATSATMGNVLEIVVYRLPEPKVDAVTPFGQMTTGPAERCGSSTRTSRGMRRPCSSIP